MKNSILPLLLVSCMFLLTSCEKETVQVSNSTSAEPVTSMTGVSELVIFHVSHLDRLTGERTGFVIDRNGQLKTYQLNAAESAKLPSNGTWLEEEVAWLFTTAKTRAHQIGEDDMVEYYNKIRAAATGEYSERFDNSTENTVHSYHAFTASRHTVGLHYVCIPPATDGRRGAASE